VAIFAFFVDGRPAPPLNEGALASPETETSALLRQWHTGDREALNGLLERHLPAIREHVGRRLGAQLRAKETISDIVQDTVMQVLRYGPRFQVSDARHFHLLMARIVENVLRDKNDWYRARRRDRARECPLPPDSAIELGGPMRQRNPLSTEADRHEREAFVRMGLELLEPERREILVLRLWDGLSFAVIGERLGVSADAASKRCQRAMIDLGKTMRSLRHGDIGGLLGDVEAEA
jgi:RNA polymerase sigma factor (sigma-70 family)